MSSQLFDHSPPQTIVQLYEFIKLDSLAAKDVQCAVRMTGTVRRKSVSN